jgi:predicted nucleic acid-binding Zn finger protein
MRYDALFYSMAEPTKEHLVLEQLLQELRTEREISRLNWLRLRGIFGNRFTRAWRLVTENRVKKYMFRPSGRELWIAVGKNAEYMIYPNAGYCSCSDFYFRVLDQEVALCYHLLAQKLAEAMSHYDVILEDDEVYGELTRIWKGFSVMDWGKPK